MAQQQQEAPVPKETAAGRDARKKGSEQARAGQRDERTTMMMYMTLTLMAGLITVMFVATAVSSVTNAVRESYAARDALSRSAALQF